MRAVESLARDLPVAYAIVGPSCWGDGNYPPSDAVYYPLYTMDFAKELSAFDEAEVGRIMRENCLELLGTSHG